MRSREASSNGLPPELELEDISMALTDDKGRSLEAGEGEEEEEVRTVRVKVRVNVAGRRGWECQALLRESDRRPR